jgi:nitroreductase
MEFNKLLGKRFSVRSYTSQKVEKSLILEVLEAARLAPSAVNFQPWHFIVLTDQQNLTEFQEVYQRAWFREVPACIVVCSDHAKSWKRKSDGKDFADVDVAITVDHLILKATELGLGTCWICNFDVPLARKKLNIPEHIEPLVIVSIGYTTEDAPVKLRKPLSELVHWEKFKCL